MKKRIWSVLLAFCMVLSLLPIGALAAEQTVRVGAGQEAGRALSARPSTGFGIDVSHHQDVIDWNQTKDYIDFAIIRCGYGDDADYQDDRQFLRNAQACEALGIPYGIYFYSYAEDDYHMQSEVSHVLRLLQGRTPTLPVYLDLEEDAVASLGNAAILRHARAFCTAVANAGFRPGVYANYYWWTHYLTSSEYDQWSRWIARYGASDPGYSGDYDFWQYSSTGRIAGISGDVDLNYAYCEIRPQTCTHSYTASQELAPACTTGGVMRYTCSLCGDSYTQAIPALGHDWNQTVLAPTCTEEGCTVSECRRCHEIKVADETPALGHSYENGVCIRCGAADPQGDPAVIRIGSAEGKAGEVVRVPVSIEQNTGFAGFTFEVTADDALVLTDIAKGDLLSGSESGAFTKNVRGRLVNWTAPEDLTGDGVLLYLKFKIADEAAAGSYEISIALKDGQSSNFVNENGVAIPFTSETGTVTVKGQSEPVNPFVDVAKGKFYYDPVLWAISQDPQITTGVDAAHFEPDRICTRAHVVTFLWRANGCPEPQSLTSSFKDVKNTSKYYYKAVLWAAEQGITTGYSDGTFRPDDECTRGQVVTFLWRANGQPKPTVMSNPFSDVPAGKYYTNAVLWALQTGITKGRTSTTFGPEDPCTRGHVVTFLYRDMG